MCGVRVHANLSLLHMFGVRVHANLLLLHMFRVRVHASLLLLDMFGSVYMLTYYYFTCLGGPQTCEVIIS
jgi:hypothetical protein